MYLFQLRGGRGRGAFEWLCFSHVLTSYSFLSFYSEFVIPTVRMFQRNIDLCLKPFIPIDPQFPNWFLLIVGNYYEFIWVNPKT